MKHFAPENSVNRFYVVWGGDISENVIEVRYSNPRLAARWRDVFCNINLFMQKTRLPALWLAVVLLWVAREGIVCLLFC